MKDSLTRAAGRLGRAVGAAAALAGLIAAWGAEADHPEAAPPGATTAQSPSKCASVIIRHCRAQFVPDPGATPQGPGQMREIPGHWEAVRESSLDLDEILIEEERLHEPAVREVLERYLKSPPEAFNTRTAPGGARCTTITSTGATFCSPSGAQPGSNLPHADFSDGAF